jgi:hypothetical protein
MPTSTVDRTIEEAQAALTVKRAFGEPFKVDGLTIVPAARVAGGGAGGGANNKTAGWGTGFGLVSQPLGIYVIDAKNAHWVPAAAPNGLLALIGAPIAALRRLVFGPEPYEAKVRELPKRVAPAAARQQAVRTRRRAQV